MKRTFIILVFLMVLIMPWQAFAQNQAGQGHLGFHFGALQLMGGDESSEMGGVAGFNFGFMFTEKFGFDVSIDKAAATAAQDEEMDLKTFFYPTSFGFRYFLKNARFNPYITAGVGFFLWDIYDVTDEEESFLPLEAEGHKLASASEARHFLLFGLGSQFYINKTITFDLSLRYNHLDGNKIDLSGWGDEHTSYVEVRAGITFQFKCDKDTDGDGIKDKDDLDPLNPEDFDNFEDEDGAPDLDNDMDGVLDVNDGAPLIPEDIDNFEDSDGIPDIDNDGDGILDVNDKAPNQPEDFDNFQDYDGAPDLDNDMDGILDVDDKCPFRPETVNGFEDEDGCPDTKPEIFFEEKAAIVLEGVNFATSSANLTAGAKEVLDKVVLTLVDYPEINLGINGFTDSMGSRDYNIMLSKQRAESVLNYLVEMGISPERLSADGFGPDNPVAPNDTREGRAKNRRIEFIRVD